VGQMTDEMIKDYLAHHFEPKERARNNLSKTSIKAV